MPIQFTSATIPDWLKQRSEAILGGAENQFKAPFVPYKGSRLSPYNDDLTKSFQMGREIGLYNPYLQSAGNYITEARKRFPDLYKNYMNPYLDTVVNDIATRGNKNFTENLLPALEREFVKRGQHGGGHHAKLAARAAQQAHESIIRQQNEARMRGYETVQNMFNADQSRQLGAAQQRADLGKLSQALRGLDIVGLQEQGKFHQHHKQKELDQLYNDFLRQQNFPQERLSQYTASLSGVPYSAPSYTVNTTPPVPTLNTWGNIGAVAPQLLGMGMMGGNSHKRGGHIRRKTPRKGIVDNLQLFAKPRRYLK
jgi:hypothetical protein